jgi:uncharacterized protein
MKLHLDRSDARYRITGYRPGAVMVNETVLTASFVLTDMELLSDWPPQRFADLHRSHFERVAALAPELVLLGSGWRQRFPSISLIEPLLAGGIGVETMDTGAACRTFNILVAEGRRVAAALLVAVE